MKKQPTTILIASILGLGTLLALSLASCAGTLEDPDRFQDSVDCADVPTQIFGKKCVGSGCHSSTKPAADLDLESPGVEARLLAHKDTQCDGDLINVQTPRESLLYNKITPNPACGVQMPLGQRGLSTKQLKCVETWIASLGSAGGAGSSGASGAGTAGTGTSGAAGAAGSMLILT
jgi:hypothetical protein